MLSDRFPPSSVSQSCRLWGLRGGGHGFWAAIPVQALRRGAQVWEAEEAEDQVPTFHVGLSFPNLWVRGGKTAALIMHLLFRPPAAPAASVGIKRFFNHPIVLKASGHSLRRIHWARVVRGQMSSPHGLLLALLPCGEEEGTRPG